MSRLKWGNTVYMGGDTYTEAIISVPVKIYKLFLYGKIRKWDAPRWRLLPAFVVTHGGSRLFFFFPVRDGILRSSIVTCYDHEYMMILVR